MSAHAQPKQVVLRRKMADWRLNSIGNVPGHRDCSPGRRHRGRFPVQVRLITEDRPGSHKWLVVTYNIAASVVTPHCPLDLWVGAARRTNLEVWGALHFGIRGDFRDDGGVGFSGRTLHEAQSVASRFPEAFIKLAGIDQLVGPIFASELRFSEVLLSAKLIQARRWYMWMHTTLLKSVSQDFHPSTAHVSPT